MRTDTKKIYNKLLKVSIVGKSQAGKSCLANRLINNDISGIPTSTVILNINSVDHTSDGWVTKLELFDISGKEKYKSIANSYLANSLIVLCVDLTDFKDYVSVKNPSIEYFSNINIPDNAFKCVVVFTKLDLVEVGRYPTDAQLRSIANHAMEAAKVPKEMRGKYIVDTTFTENADREAVISWLVSLAPPRPVEATAVAVIAYLKEKQDCLGLTPEKLAEHHKAIQQLFDAIEQLESHANYLKKVSGDDKEVEQKAEALTKIANDTKAKLVEFYTTGELTQKRYKETLQAADEQHNALLLSTHRDKTARTLGTVVLSLTLIGAAVGLIQFAVTGRYLFMGATTRSEQLRERLRENKNSVRQIEGLESEKEAPTDNNTLHQSCLR